MRKKTFFRLGYGFSRQRNGAVNMHAASCIAAVTGSWQYEGGGAFHNNGAIYKWRQSMIDGADVVGDAAQHAGAHGEMDLEVAHREQRRARIFLAEHRLGARETLAVAAANRDRRAGLRRLGWPVSSWEHRWIAQTPCRLEDPSALASCLKLLDALEDLDDVRSATCQRDPRSRRPP